jgi:hypothetical protein
MGEKGLKGGSSNLPRSLLSSLSPSITLYTGMSSQSPSPGPSNSALDAQRRQLEKLLANPDKEVFIPKPSREKTLRPPREIIKVRTRVSFSVIRSVPKLRWVYRTSKDRVLVQEVESFTCTNRVEGGNTNV